MFETGSRYSTLLIQKADVLDPQGNPRTIRFVGRRFIPPLETMVTLVEHEVTEGDRLDNVTARYLGDPTQFWRVADANAALRPEELTAEPGRFIVIAQPQA